jgi:hypothetical protein
MVRMQQREFETGHNVTPKTTAQAFHERAVKRKAEKKHVVNHMTHDQLKALNARTSQGPLFKNGLKFSTTKR